MVARRHTTETPAVLNYSYVVSRDSGQIVLIISAMNDLKVSLCDIQNTFLTAKCQDKIWKRTGIEFDSNQDKKSL